MNDREPEAFVFIIGAPRSGTTWLHLMMGAHGRFATGQESQLFERYLSVIADRWQEELDWPDTEDVRKHGISSYLTDEDFTALLRDAAMRVYTPALALKEGATHVLEKSPNNARHTALIHRCFPEARFIHVIRDGRDVANSMMRASEGWGRSWAPSRIEDAGRSWKDSVRAARTTPDFSPWYTEVRYERLLSDGVEALVELFDFCQIPVTEADATEIYGRFSFDKLKAGDYERSVFVNPGVSAASGTEERKEPRDFFRKGVSGQWKEAFSPGQLRAFNWVAGDLLSELGYADPSETAASKPPVGVRLREARQGLRRGVVNLGRRLLGS